MLHGWCVLKTEGRIEGMASVADRPVLSSPVVGNWGPGLIGRAILQRMNGTASLMCSRPPNGPNRCVLSAVSPDDGYGFGDLALEAVDDLDIPSDPEGTPVRVDFAFTLAEPRTTTCD